MGVLKRKKIILMSEKDMSGEITIHNNVIKNLVIPRESRAIPSWNWCIDGVMNKGLVAPAMFWLAANSINFRFWNLENGLIQKYERNGKTGSTAMMISLREAWGDSDSPKNLKRIDRSNGWKDVFDRIPALKERKEILHEMLDGDKLEIAAALLVDRCMNNHRLSVEDAIMLSKHFPLGYGRDKYLKKAQLAISAIGGFIVSKGYRVSMDLTAMADYQVPRVLRSLGIISYSESLAQMVNASPRILINEGSQEERALRGGAVIACEKIAEVHGMNAIAVDHALWMSQDIAGKSNFHLTITTNY